MEVSVFGEKFGEAIVSLIFRFCTPQKETQQDYVATTLQETELHLDRLEKWEQSAIALA